MEIKEKDVLGHRKRVKERFLNTGFDGWQDYEILELVLFYVLPRKDTKQIAKDLIKEFGSLKELLTADHDKLLKILKNIDGAGPNTAFFFRFLKEISIKYSEFKIKDKYKVSSPQEVVEFLKNKIGNCEEEQMYAIFLNASNKVLKYESISEGTAGRSAVYPSKIVKGAISTERTRSVIVAHNHPGGFCKPSQNDIIATEAIQKALKTVDFVLLDHIIVTDSDYYSFKDNGLI